MAQFKRIGGLKLQSLIEAGLQPGHRILDVGCGSGQLAIPLARYLMDPGGYEGFDIAPSAINWCRREITSRYPHVRFQLADVYNKFYHPAGRDRASEYRFPYDRASFDFVFLGSVFTHVLTEDVANYVAEIARVLKRHGKCLASYYLLNADSRQAIDDGRSCLRFPFVYGPDGCRLESEEIPEAVVAHDEEFVRNLYARNGVSVGGVHHGEWSKGVHNDQDAVLAVKE